MSKDENLTIISGMLPEIQEHLTHVTELHKRVSEEKTPPIYVETKENKQTQQKFSYVKIGYLKAKAEEHYPGWSWEIINTEALGTEAYVVHGRLKWFDCGIQRTGDMVAAHRIQRSKKTGNFLDIGNDIKAANTDCMKKAINMFLNISDDVYNNQIVDLSDEEKVLIKEKMLEAGFPESEMNRIDLNVKKGKITQLNLEDLLNWIEDFRLKQEKETK